MAVKLDALIVKVGENNRILGGMVIYQAELRVERGRRDEYISKLVESQLEASFRSQPRNVFCDITASITDPDVIVICDVWENHADFDAHVASDECKTWFALFEE